MIERSLEQIKHKRRMGKPTMIEKYLQFQLYGDEKTGKTVMTQKGDKIEKSYKLPQLTNRQLYVLLVLFRDTNYMYSTWRELNDEMPKLNICLSATRAIFNKFEREGMIRKMHNGITKPGRGPKRNLFAITIKGKYIARFYLDSMQRIINKPTGRI